MARKNLKVRVDDEGRMEVVDPGYDTLELLRSINPDFEIRMAPLPLFSAPRFLTARKMCCGLNLGDLKNISDEELWKMHSCILERIPSATEPKTSKMASLLELKIELSYRLLKSCRLCGRRCGVDRTAGEKGLCGLGMEAMVYEHFVHIAEEPPVNPSLNLFLAGCGLQCRFCQQGHLLDTTSIFGERLDASFWKQLNRRGARSLSFIGGNPDESLLPILQFLSVAPKRWNLPIVWNCNAYASVQTIKLLHGVADVYIPDLKYGNADCGDKMAGAPNYWEIARIAISSMLKQRVPVIVRILVLPEHNSCCYEPILKYLADLSHQDNLFISVRDQYCPEGPIHETNHNAMLRRTTKVEIEQVTALTGQLHLNIME